MMSKMFEPVVEEATRDWLGELQSGPLHGLDIAPEGPESERHTYDYVLLIGRLQTAFERINGSALKSASLIKIPN